MKSRPCLSPTKNRNENRMHSVFKGTKHDWSMPTFPVDLKP